MYLMPEQIAQQTKLLTGKANRQAINKLFRDQDESHKWPVCGKLDVTERAIRMSRKLTTNAYGLEYALLLNQLISGIVNGKI